MRLDADRGDRNWNVYHAERCEMLTLTVWVDDETNEWCEFVLLPLRVPLERRVHRARKIQILAARKLVIINPIEDSDTSERETERAILEPAL